MRKIPAIDCSTRARNRSSLARKACATAPSGAARPSSSTVGTLLMRELSPGGREMANAPCYKPARYGSLGPRPLELQHPFAFGGLLRRRSDGSHTDLRGDDAQRHGGEARADGAARLLD